MEEEYGWGTGSTIALVLVALILLFAPLGMGPLQPPPALLLLFFPVTLVALFYFLHQASK
ncbi:uncharacterized protein LOC8287284 [Ricinus communis]|nr:uncharacterized protein LOC8287284 [Ricinus communis]|eukprot:XP_025015120.1 uncharacterized protein LOC8287284 [Ricinus communis]